MPGKPVYDDFHTYTIDWSPERIEWSIDGQVVRTREKKDTCDETGLCKFPSDPAYVDKHSECLFMLDNMFIFVLVVSKLVFGMEASSLAQHNGRVALLT